MIVPRSFLQHFTEDSVQALACVKYISTLAVSFADSTFRSRPHADPKAPGPANTPAKQALQRQLILVIGCIDVLAYAAFCTGFAYCDGAIATLLLAGGGQIFTAILSKYVLKKPLSQGQVLGVWNLLLLEANHCTSVKGCLLMLCKVQSLNVWMSKAASALRGQLLLVVAVL